MYDLSDTKPMCIFGLLVLACWSLLESLFSSTCWIVAIC